MSDKIRCGEGEHCLRCKFYDKLNEIGALAGFTKNKLGRCDWYSSKNGDDAPKIVT